MQRLVWCILVAADEESNDLTLHRRIIHVGLLVHVPEREGRWLRIGLMGWIFFFRES